MKSMQHLARRTDRRGRALGFLLSASLFFLFAACETDAYDKGDGEYSLTRADMVELHADANKQADYADTDEGRRLWLANPFTARWITTADSTYRTILYYNETTDGKAQAVGLGSVLTLTPRVFSQLTTHPVRFESAWVSTTRRYLNAGLYVLTGTNADGDTPQQAVGAAIDTLLTHANGLRTLQLTLHHDQGDAPQYYSQRAYVSIPLSAVEADSVCLRINTYDGWVVKTWAIK